MATAGAGSGGGESRVVPPLSESELTVREASSPEDVERVAEFNATTHGPCAGNLTRALFLHHPHTQLADLLFIEHAASQAVVSSLCLIPWTWRLGGVEIVAGEMGIVGTAEAYRGRGLARQLVVRFERRLLERNCLLSHIQGIPGFYSRFGYEYALPLEGGVRLEFRDVPARDSGALRLRRGSGEDLCTLSSLYDAATADLAVSAVRDASVWQFLNRHAPGTDTECERWLVVAEGGEAVGYFGLPRHHFGDDLLVGEVSRLNYDEALFVLQQAVVLAKKRHRPGLRLCLPEACTLTRLARSLGAQDLGRYGWQVRVPDHPRLLRAMAPLLARRLARSTFTGLSRCIDVDLYDETLRLCFSSGSLEQVEQIEHTPTASIRIPRRLFVQLLLGSRTREGLESWHPDVLSLPADRMLIDILFPPLAGFLNTPY